MRLAETFGADWQSVLMSPVLAGFAVSASDAGGAVGAVQEASATARALSEARHSVAPGSLVAEILATQDTAEGADALREGLLEVVHGRVPALAASAAVDRLAQAAQAVERHAPDEAQAFKEWLRAISYRVAEAATEGGLLGFGTESVSEAERRTLADIDRALGFAPPQEEIPGAAAPRT
jgi:hypothetical protein